MTTNVLVGVALIVLGLVVMAFGDKTVQAKGGIVLKMFSQPRPIVLVLKWIVGLGSAYFGYLFLIGGIEL